MITSRSIVHARVTIAATSGSNTRLSFVSTHSHLQKQVWWDLAMSSWGRASSREGKRRRISHFLFLPHISHFYSWPLSGFWIMESLVFFFLFSLFLPHPTDKQSSWKEPDFETHCHSSHYPRIASHQHTPSLARLRGSRPKFPDSPAPTVRMRKRNITILLQYSKEWDFVKTLRTF